MEKAGWVIWLAFLLWAGCTYCIWASNDWFPPVGDEPPYLIIASSISQDHSLELSAAFKREFAQKSFWPLEQIPQDGEPTEKSTHCVAGAAGLHSVHGIGLPFLLALPYWLAGVHGARFFLVALSSSILVLVWSLTGLYTRKLGTRVLATLPICFAAPFFLAANQIYPDLPAGVIALIVGYWLLRTDAYAPTRAETSSGRLSMGDAGTKSCSVPLVLAVLIAFLPWLHLKFLAAALIMACAVSWETYRNNRTLRCTLPMLIVFVLSLFLLAGYNSRAFGVPWGPYRPDALELSPHAVMVFAGLHLDRFQGLFIQNPAYFFGLLFLVPFVRRYKQRAVVTLLVYLSFTIPNALHPNWYGGHSFAGRFAWSGAVTLLPIVVYSLTTLLDNPLSARFGRFCAGGLIALAFTNWLRCSFQHLPLYNPAWDEAWVTSIPCFSYESFYPWGQSLLPAMYDSTNAFCHPANIIFVAFCLGLIWLGTGYGSVDERRILRRVAFLFISFLLSLVITGALFATPDLPVVWKGSQLRTEIGLLNGDARTAAFPRSKSGFVTLGPYVKLEPGVYDFVVVCSAAAAAEGGLPAAAEGGLSAAAEGGLSSACGAAAVAWLDIFVPSQGRRLFHREIMPSLERQKIPGLFEIDETISGQEIELRVFFLGSGSVTVHSFELSNYSK